VNLVLSSFVFFNGIKVHVGDMDRVMGSKEWPIDELWPMWHFRGQNSLA